MKTRPIVLAIDTSCDDTAAAVTCGLEVWSNVIASQTELHRPYGGVFPTVAKQAHKEHIASAVQVALRRAKVTQSDVDAIAVTIGPGLAPALEVGIAYAQTLASDWQVPLLAANHIEGHLQSVLAFGQHKSQQTIAEKRAVATTRTTEALKQSKLPALSVIVSGGHTQFVLVDAATKHQAEPAMRYDRQPRLGLARDPQDPERTHLSGGRFTYRVLGQTVDDAAGEALDKIGRMLNLGYPAGPVIEQLAKQGNPSRYEFPLPMTTTRDYNLSFSGMKTFARRFIEQRWGESLPSAQETFDFCASLQYAVFRHICYKLNKILLDVPEITEVWLGGGVAANATLRSMLRQTLRSKAHQPRHLKLKTPYTKRLCMDNAAMVGISL